MEDWRDLQLKIMAFVTEMGQEGAEIFINGNWNPDYMIFRNGDIIWIFPAPIYY